MINSSLSAGNLRESRRDRAATCSKALQLTELCAEYLGQLRIPGLYFRREYDPKNQFEPVDIVAHDIERGPAESGFAAIGLALSDLVSELRGPVEQTLRGQPRVFTRKSVR
jgi:hypothetical protein